tara:strand:- start:4170 stop:5315 length:1146 start_codon:yes stop_codon:yes gene_type:complete
MLIEYDICRLIDKKTNLKNTIFMIGNGNSEFGYKVANEFKNAYECCICDCQPSKFPNGEIRIDSINDNIRQRDVIIIQSMVNCYVNDEFYSVNDLFMELCVMIDAVKRGSARSVTVVLPMFPYQRQDRKDASRRPISARMITTILESLQVSRVIVFDLHAGQIQGFFGTTPLDNLFSEPYFIKYIKEKYLDNNHYLLDNIVIVSPDEGGLKRAVRIANKLSCSSAFIYKERDENNKVANMTILGNIKDKVCIIVDDIIDTGGTACKAAEVLKEKGAVEVIMCACHGIFSNNSINKIIDSQFNKVIVTNTVFSDKIKNGLLYYNNKKESAKMIKNNKQNTNLVHLSNLSNKIDILDVSIMCAIAVERCLNGQSLKELLDVNV